MAQFNTKPIHIQIRDINHNLIQNATIKVIERKTNKILYNAKSPSGEIILDDIENLKDCYAFRVEIAHPHYKSIPKTNAPCIREANINKPHTLEFNYQDKLLVSNVYAEITDKRDSTHTNDTKDNAANTLETNNRDSTIQNNANTISLPQENHTLIQQEAQAINHLQIYLKAYYNQDTIPNKEKQSNDKKQHYQKQKKETKWGYIVFDKDKDIDSTLKELTKDSTIPLIKLKEFTRISKEDCIPHTLHQKQYDTQELRVSKIDNAESKTNTSHIQNNQASRDSNNTNKDYLLGEEINIVFKEEWEDKQVRFFAYLWRSNKDVGVDVELRVYHYVIQVAHTEQEEEAWYENEKLWSIVDIVSLGIAFIPAGGLAASVGIKAGAEGAKVAVRWAGKKFTKRALRMRSIQNKTTIKQYEYKIIRYITRSTNRVAKPKYLKQSINAMSHNVRARYEERVKNGWDFRNAKNWKKKPRDKFSSGKKWHNDLNQLPTKDSKGNPIFYREHDVNEKISKKAKRDAERILTGHDKDGKLLEDYIYHTKDHYETFTQIILE